MSTELVNKTTGELTLVSDFSFEQDAGMGGQKAKASDMAIPFCKLAQKLNPEVDAQASNYIEDLSPGDYFSTVTRAVYKGSKGFRFVPVAFNQVFLEWRPRESGNGGLVAERPESEIDSCTMLENGTLLMPNNNHLVPTCMWYGYVLDDNDQHTPIVISLSKTGVKVSKALMSLLKFLRKQGKNGLYNPPFYYNIVRVTSKSAISTKGPYFVWNCALEGSIESLPNGKAIAIDSKDFCNSVMGGRTKVDMANTAQTAAEEDIPF